AVTPLKLVGVGGGELTVSAPGSDGTRRPVAAARRLPSTGAVAGEVTAPRAGRHRVTLARGKQGDKGDRIVACRDIDVAARAPKPDAPPPPSKGVWEAKRAWDRRSEDLYSAWIEQLFDAPAEASLDFRPLAQALRDPARNFLY